MFYFISSKNFDKKIIKPRVPINRASKEDCETKRICVSKSLIGALESTTLYFRSKRIYVHTCDSNDVIQPTRQQVNDSFMSGEEWIMSDVEMTLFTILYIDKEIINDQYSKWNFKNKDETINFYIIDFDYERVYNKKFIKKENIE
jgi:hypothetical protein